MLSTRQKLRLSSALGVLAIAALGVGCRGFFVNPVLSSITVQPANPTIETGRTNNTVQMTVSGTNNDGSLNSHPSVTWSITPTSTATVNTTGLVTSVSTGTATVTATSTQNSSITGTQTVNVTVGCIQSIAISPPTATFTNGGTTTATFKATATTCNGAVDITSFASWFSSNTNEVTVSAGVATATQTAGQDSPVVISASSGGITSTTNATITVSGF